jgi:tetratricopeptide (TPR) repeat protein
MFSQILNMGFAVFVASFMLAWGTNPIPEIGFKVRETGNKLEVTSPWGVKSYETEFNLGAMKHYKIEIPLEDLRPAMKAQMDRPESPREIASVPGSSAATVVGSCENPRGTQPEYAERKPNAIPDTPSEYDSTDRLILEANHLYNRGKFYEASVYVEELIRKNPGFVRAWVMKGSLLYVQGYSDLAKKAWAQAAALDPADPQVKDILKRYP